MKEENLLKDWVMLEYASPKLVRILTELIRIGFDLNNIEPYILSDIKGVGKKTVSEFIKLRDAEIDLEYCNSAYYKRDLLFIDFLKKNNAYDSFSLHLNNNHLSIGREFRNNNIKGTIRYLSSLCPGKYDISNEVASAFIWQDSIEGDRYWSNLSDKWYNVCKSNGLV